MRWRPRAGSGLETWPRAPRYNAHVRTYATTLLGVILVSTLMAGELCLGAQARVSSQPLVGHIMALLAVFEEARVLPPESSPQANALIHALIQLQAALTKSTDPATRRWFTDALQRAHLPDSKLLPPDALTTRTLEAILTYAITHPPAAYPAVRAGLQEFHIGQADLDLLARIYWEATESLLRSRRDIHQLYDAQRQTMP